MQVGGKFAGAYRANPFKQPRAAVVAVYVYHVVYAVRMRAECGELKIHKVLMVADENGIKTGAEVENAKVTATVVKQDKAKKIIVFKYKAKKNERKKQGHRQPFTAVKVEAIEL